MVYTAQLKSDDPPSREKLINELVELLVTDLTQRGLLPPETVDLGARTAPGVDRREGSTTVGSSD